MLSNVRFTNLPADLTYRYVDLVGATEYLNTALGTGVIRPGQTLSTGDIKTDRPGAQLCLVVESDGKRVSRVCNSNNTDISVGHRIAQKGVAQPGVTMYKDDTASTGTNWWFWIGIALVALGILMYLKGRDMSRNPA